MTELLDAVKRHVESMIHSLGAPRLGTVSSYDPAAHSVKVTIEPEGILTGWLPVSTMAAADGMTMMAAPPVGSQVLVLPIEGDIEHGVVVGSLHFDGARPPKALDNPNGSSETALKPGEILLRHPAGVTLRVGPLGIVIDGDVGIKGDLFVTGDVVDAKGSMDGLRTHYNAHKHGGAATDKPDPGGDAPPTPPWEAL